MHKILQSLGKRPTGERLQKIKQSPNYKKGKFQNLLPTPVMRPGVTPLTLAKEFFAKPESVRPAHMLPMMLTDFHRPDTPEPTITWFGHSSYLLQSRGRNILVDPVFSRNASPVPFFMPGFPGTNVYKADDFPAIDVLVITHDHYDHLDFETIQNIHRQCRRIVTALGVGAHLESWGVNPKKIIELDWGQSADCGYGIRFTAVPARHFSGRGFVRAKTLWMALVLDLHGKRIYMGGDSGYDGDQFRQAGRNFPGIDLAILECGQYNENWPHIHMFPEETVQAAIDLVAKVLLPVHWGKFALSTHPWKEPVERMVAAAEQQGQGWVVPILYQQYVIGAPFRQELWWNYDWETV